MSYFVNGSDDPDVYAGDIAFHDTSSAGSGVFTLLPELVSNAEGGIVYFLDSSSADFASFFNSGLISFQGAANAGGGYFESEGGTAPDIAGGLVVLSGGSNGGSGIFVNNAGSAIGAPGAFMLIRGFASAGDASIFANSGAGEGATIDFAAASKTAGGTARITLNGKGKLDISDSSNSAAIAIGALGGDGLVFLGSRTLKTGARISIPALLARSRTAASAVEPAARLASGTQPAPPPDRARSR